LAISPVLTVRTRLFYARRELLAMLAEEPALTSLAAELSGDEPDDDDVDDDVEVSDAAPAKEPA
jgi:hypothetical protein